jgi:hypothetical protein
MGTWSLSRRWRDLVLGYDHPPASKAEVRERIELYLYSPS